MVRANKVYLEDIIEYQGYLFWYVVKQGIDLDSYVNMYMKCKFKRFIDTGGAYHVNRYGKEIFEECGVNCTVMNDNQDAIQAQWIGEFYALAQWRLGIYSSELIELLPIKELKKRYNVLHDLDLRVAVDKYCSRLGKIYD